uniref:DUF4955 domain-containing protein n=1 Tax=Hymenobacter terrenus TaxID=1629124 RepID=UPI000619A27D
MKKSSFALMLLISASTHLHAQNTARIYTDWLANPQTSKLPDYSYAGYRQGETPPTVAGPIFNVTSYGAVANDGLDDIVAIQKAVDAAVSAGGGVVLFPAGTFDFDVTTQNQSVRIAGNNVVVRGAGSGTTGTILYDHRANNNNDAANGWETQKYPNFFRVSSVDIRTKEPFWYPVSVGATALTTASPAPRNAKVITVADGSKITVNQCYTLTQQDPDQSLIKALAPGMTTFGSFPGATSGNHAIKFRQIIKVVAKSGNQITIDAPVRFELKAAWSPKIFATEHPVIREVGIENLRFKTDWNGTFKHHATVEADYGYHHIRFDWVENGWVRNTVHDGASMAVDLRSTKNCLVDNCKIIGVQGHHGFATDGEATNNLMSNLDGNNAYHTWTIENTATGNVYKNCISKETSSIDCHGGDPAIYNLFDNLSGGIAAGGGSGNKATPPSHSIGLTLWNWQVGDRSPYTNNLQPIFVDAITYNGNNAPGFIAAGVRGKSGQTVFYTDLNKAKQTADVNQPWGYAESIGTAVSPVSLYDAQRSVRLGGTPPPVSNASPSVSLTSPT